MTTTATTTPSVQVSYAFFFQRDRKSDTNVIRHYVQAPSSANMCFYTCSVPDVFQRISVWIRVRLTIILSAFFSWFLSFFSLAWRITCQRLFENSNWFGKNFLALDSWVLLPPPRIFELVRTLRFLSCYKIMTLSYFSFFFLTFYFFSWYRNILLPNLIIMSNISRCSHSTLSLGNFLCI